MILLIIAVAWVAIVSLMMGVCASAGRGREDSWSRGSAPQEPQPRPARLVPQP